MFMLTPSTPSVFLGPGCLSQGGNQGVKAKAGFYIFLILILFFASKELRM